MWGIYHQGTSPSPSPASNVIPTSNPLQVQTFAVMAATRLWRWRAPRLKPQGRQGKSGFDLRERGGGGFDRAPKDWGAGWEKVYVVICVIFLR